MEIRVLGIDPSLRNFGLAHAVIDSETLEVRIEKLLLTKSEIADKKTRKVVRKNSDDLARARILHNAMREACEGKAFAIVEVPVGSQSARAMASYGICIGILASCSIPLIEVTPSEVKVIATGKKTATKQEMIDWASELHPEANWLTQKRKGKLELINANEHLADAVAAVYAGLETTQFQLLLATMRAALEEIEKMAQSPQGVRASEALLPPTRNAGDEYQKRKKEELKGAASLLKSRSSPNCDGKKEL